MLRCLSIRWADDNILGLENFALGVIGQDLSIE